MAMTFEGFPKDLFKFLAELAANNNREWFNANKPRYEQSVVEPVIEFISAFDERLNSISENFITDTRRNGGSMFRIYRDTRFSRDKRPYKENVGCHFRHIAGKDAHAPGFYLHLQPGNVFVGAGIWLPPGPALDSIRTAIVENPDSWKKIVNSKMFLKRFGEIQGDRLKRPPRGYDPDHELLHDLKLKSFFIKQSLSDSDVQSPKFIDDVNKVYTEAAPLMKFLTNAVGLPF